MHPKHLLPARQRHQPGTQSSLTQPIRSQPVAPSDESGVHVEPPFAELMLSPVGTVSHDIAKGLPDQTDKRTQGWWQWTRTNHSIRYPDSNLESNHHDQSDY